MLVGYCIAKVNNCLDSVMVVMTHWSSRKPAATVVGGVEGGSEDG